MESASQMLSNVGPNSLRVATEKLAVVRDDQSEQVERSYLTIHGTPDAYRWLAKLLNEMADSASDPTNPGGHSVLVDSSDLAQVDLEEWDSISLDCRQQLDPDT